MSRNSKVFRFAFGTREVPGTSTWRIVSDQNGNIYINNAAQFGNEIHIALHASGEFSVKLGLKEKGGKRYPLEPPFIQKNSELIHGPFMFFLRQKRNLPPAPATGSIKKINWLGWPKEGHMFILAFSYCPLKRKIELRSNEKILYGPINVKLFHEDKNFYLTSLERKIEPQEVPDPQDPNRKLEFKESLPDTIDMIRIAKTPQGPSAIIIEGFNALIKAT
ncbi:MAG: hypothetical protein KC736_02590 [Candidatus Moranbacteria bacterium]|nr:hypothetical protein [Candidatus Moranbacteria bacterium]